MLKNYLTIAFRTLQRHKGYTFINVFGLAFGLACCLLIGLYVYDEFSYDDFHADAERLYFVGKESIFGERRSEGMATQLPLARALEQDVAGVEKTTTTTWTRATNMRPLGAAVSEESEHRLLFADSTFLEMFSFPLLQGNAATALDAPNTIVITEALARTLFGDADAVGQQLVADEFSEEDPFVYTVTGILAPLPRQSYFEFEALASLSTLRPTRLSKSWSGSMYLTFARLAPEVAPAPVEQRFEEVVRTYMGDEAAAKTRYFLLPLTELYLSDITPERGFKGSRRYLLIFGSIALFILLVAIVNYMNLATARTAKRVREVGVRRTVGASRGQVARQFLMEAGLVTALAFLLALALAQLVLPVFNHVFDKELALAELFGWRLVGLGLALLVGTGLIAGSYPALYLSRFRPARLMRQEAGGRGGAVWLRKGLVVLQFGITVVLLVATATVYRQLQFTAEKDLGFAGEQVLAVNFADNAMAYQHEVVKARVLQHPGVLAASATNSVPGKYGMQYGFYPDSTDRERTLTVYMVKSDPDYVETLGLDVVAGRDFGNEQGAAAAEVFLVNETAAAAMGGLDVVGQTIRGLEPDNNRIVGVLRDYHFLSFEHAIKPVVIRIDEPLREQEERPYPPYYHLLVRFQPERVGDVLAHLHDVWAEFGVAKPPEVRFLDDLFAEMYATERRLGQVFSVFALIAIVIACLGLFGLAAYAAEQRTKEIGIRKVLGATHGGLVALLSRDFLVLVGVAFAVAMPVAYVLMSRWLENFAYRAELGAGIFLLAGVLALVIALGTVSYQAVRAALRNPVEALRYE